MREEELTNRAIGNQLMQARMRAGLTQDEVAQKCGVAYQRVQVWEQGKLSVPRLCILCKIYNASADAILFIDRERPPIISVRAFKKALAYEQAPENVRQVIDGLLLGVEKEINAA